MKFITTISLLISCLIVFSCTKVDEINEQVDETNEQMSNPNEEISLDSLCPGPEPIIPEDFEIDLNDDGTMDFEIIYAIGDFCSATASSFYSGRIKPIDDNQILKKKSYPILFNLEQTDIQSNVQEPLEWDHGYSSFSIVSINYCHNGKWEITWNIWTMDEQPTYLIGLKLLNNNLNETGWIEIEVDDIDGTINILDKGIK